MKYLPLFLLIFMGCFPSIYIKKVPKSQKCMLIHGRTPFGWGKIGPGFFVTSKSAQCMLYGNNKKLVRRINATNRARYCANSMQVHYVKCIDQQNNILPIGNILAGGLCPFAGKEPTCKEIFGPFSKPSK